MKQSRIDRSLAAVSNLNIILIPCRIQNRCIGVAKTVEAKRRLVNAAVCATIEEMRRDSNEN